MSERKKLNTGEKIAAVQAELKAPKGQFNKFGGYKYRNCEDILEAVKPLLFKHGLLLTITDEIVCIDGWHMLRAVAVIRDTEDAEQLMQVSAYARIPNEKKGMDASQITGAASSYARKYALNGLFLIDDTKDADTMPPETPQKAAKPKKQASTQAQAEKPDSGDSGASLNAARSYLANACAVYGAANGMTTKEVAEQVAARPDYTKDDAECYERIANELMEAVNDAS